MIAGVRGSSFYKIVYFFPQVLSVAIIALLLAVRLQPGQRRAQRACCAVGLGSIQPAWLGDPRLALWCVMAVLVLEPRRLLRRALLRRHGLHPQDIYEAALLDGAGRVTTFFRITLPLMWDTVQTGWVYMGILALGARRSRSCRS